jgi:hypothetical protein
VSGPIARRSAAVLATALLTLVWLNVAHSDAERSGRAGVIVSLDGSVSPRRLPRQRPVPVSLTLTGTIRSVEASQQVPPLESIELAFGARGGLSTAGLPSCPPARLRNANQQQALAQCGRALVGRGTISTEVLLDPEQPVLSHAGVLAFNGKAAGRPVVWIQIYSASPPVSVVLPFYVSRLRTGAYGILLRARVESGLGRWLRLRSFRVTLGRRYSAHGVRRSYLSARCPLPPRFSIGIFPLARATYRFAPGPTLTTTILRGCRVRG